MASSVFYIKAEFRKQNKSSQNSTEKHYLKLCWLPFLHSHFLLLQPSETGTMTENQQHLVFHIIDNNVAMYFYVLSLIQPFRQFFICPWDLLKIVKYRKVN